MQRYLHFKKDHNFDEKLKQKSLVKEKTFMLNKACLRCCLNAGQLTCIFNLGKEIYSKDDYCNCLIDIDNSKSS